MRDEIPYWKKCHFKGDHAEIIIQTKGFTIWCREADVYARMQDRSLKVIFAELEADDPAACGKRLIFRWQNFKPYLMEPLKNKNKENEASAWMSLESAIKLRDFLNHVIKAGQQKLA